MSTIDVVINDRSFSLPERATVVDAVAAIEATPPFAVAVNREFVPRSAYAARALQPEDRIEVIRPVTGG